MNLYSQEYFTLMRSRLTPAGLATYWLPVQELEPAEARSIVKAFCGAFPDCTLWTGSAAEWMLAGSGGGGTPPTAEEFARQWEDPVVGARLRALALGSKHLGARFLGDAKWLAEYARDVQPLTDDRPYRLSYRFPQTTHPDFLRTMATDDALERFQHSEWVARNWPEEWRRDAPEAFREQGIVNAYLLKAYGGPSIPTFALLHETLTRTSLRAVPLLLLSSTWVHQGIAERAWARGERRPEIDYILGARALSRRDYAEAVQRFESQLRQWPDARAARLLTLSQLLAGDAAAARATAAALRAKPGVADPAFQQWLDRELGASPSS